MNDMDVQLAALAAEQHGCFAEHQARHVGYSARRIRYREGRGQWDRLGENSLKFAGTPVSWRMRLRAGLFDLGDPAVVSLRASAALHGVDGFTEGPVEFTVPRQLRARQVDGALVHSTKVLPLIDRARVGGFPVTSASRTAVDLARCLTEAQLGAVIDCFVRDGWSAPEFLERRLDALRGPGRHGVRLLERVLTDAGGHSFLERRFLALVRAAGLPRPKCQVVHAVGDRFVARVDFLFEAVGVVVEVMGRRGHSTEVDRDRDAQRHAELAALGRTVLPFTSNQVFRRPGWVLETLQTVLRSAA